MGFGILSDYAERTMLIPAGSFGWDGMFASHFWADPKNKIVVVFMRNIWPTQARKYINGTDSIHFPTGLKLITYNDAEIKKFASMQRLAQVTDQVKLDYSQRAFELNKRLDSLIRKEYHLN